MFVASTAYYVRVTMYREPHWFGWHPGGAAVLCWRAGGGRPGDTIRGSAFSSHAPLAEPGLNTDDVLLEVNGRKVDRRCRSGRSFARRQRR